MGAPEVDAQHYVASRSTWWDGGEIANTLTRKGCDDRMPDKDRLFAVLQPVAGTLGNRGLRSHTELDGHGAYIPVQQPVPYDLFQITAPVNRQNRKPGDPCHTLARDNAAHAAVAFAQNQLGEVRTGDVSGTLNTNSNASGRNTPMVAVDLYNQSIDGDCAATLTEACGGTNTSGPKVMAHAFYSTGGTHGVSQHPEVSPAVKVGSGLGIPSPPAVAHAIAPTITAANDPSRSPQSSEVTQQVAAVHAASMTVRRLTPRECERLQGFPDDYTAIPWRGKAATECPDGPRYKALGNSMAVNCMAWISERIAAVDCRYDL